MRRPPPNADWTHFNAVAYNPDLDQILVSVHAFSEIWVIDHSTTTAEAASHKGGRSGKGGDLLYRWGNPRAYRNGSKTEQQLFNQHNAHWIAPGLPGEGHVLVFNNGSGRPGGQYSSVDEIVLPVDSQGQYTHPRRGPYGPDKPVWSYSAPKKSDFYSFFISGAQRLPNGNTLICTGASGMVFEVTPEKEVVWKYANPVKGGPGGFGPNPGGVDLLPFFLRDQLKLSPEQRKQIDEFQGRLSGKLEKALSADQMKQVREINPFGPGGFAALPLPGQLISASTMKSLKPTAEQKKQLDDLQKEVDTTLEKLLSADQKKEFKEAREGFARGGPFGFGPPGGPRDGDRLQEDRVDHRREDRAGRLREAGWATSRRTRRTDDGQYPVPRLSVRCRFPGACRQGAEAGQDDRSTGKTRRNRRNLQEMRLMRTYSRPLLLAVILIVLAPTPALAYIGPGAGFALAGSFFAVFAAIFSAFVTVLTWPVRLLSRTLFGWRALRRSRVKRVVILGLDGMDHGLTEKMLEEGQLPNLAALRDQGSFKPLGSTVPPISPVAWSTFQTGVNPGKHNIFDFLTPDLRTYRAKLSSVEIRPPRRSIKIGKYQIPLGRADVRLLRKSKPFWNVLGKYGIFSCIIRVPITFPPRSCTECCCRRCAFPTCAARRGCFPITRPAFATRAKRRAARSIMSAAMATPSAPI